MKFNIDSKQGFNIRKEEVSILLKVEKFSLVNIYLQRVFSEQFNIVKLKLYEKNCIHHLAIRAIKRQTSRQIKRKY